MKQNNKKILDTPRKRKGVHVTPTLPMVSCGKQDAKLLKHLLELKNSRLNVKEYARINKIPRSSVYNSLNRLELKELVKKGLADNKITNKGKIYLNATNRGVQPSRKECLTSNKLSTHYHTFVLPISDKAKFRVERLNNIKNEGFKENKLANLHQVIVDFQDAKVIINPKQIRINLFDIITDNVEDSDVKCLSRAIEYAELLKTIGINTEGLMVETGHWARVESALSDFLYKIDNRYFLELKDGSKFWIDHSDGKQEDETNNKVVRKRVDNFLNQIGTDDFDLTDINKIKESLGFITKLESSRLSDRIEENKLKRLELEKSELTKEINLDVSYIN